MNMTVNSQLVLCLLTGILVTTVMRWMGAPLSSFEVVVLIMAITAVSLLFQITYNTSKIAKSLEKKAVPTPSQTEDEQDKK